MSAIINIVNAPSPASAAVAPTVASRTHSAAPPPATQADSVEFSALGQALSRATELSSLSVARIRAIREEIAAGRFETPERIDGTVTRLLNALK